jgi:hypothetical protein
MPRKERKNKRRVYANVTPMQERWLNGERLLGSEPPTPSETMQALSLMSNALGQCEALWSAHGDSETHFWRPKMNQPISLSDLEHHEASWLTPDNDNFGGDSYFIFTYYTEAEKQKLWDDFGDKENFHWEVCLRRPIPKGASVDSAIVAFAGTGLSPFNIM